MMMLLHHQSCSLDEMLFIRKDKNLSARFNKVRVELTFSINANDDAPESPTSFLECFIKKEILITLKIKLKNSES